jgi:hypothetical protein
LIIGVKLNGKQDSNIEFTGLECNSLTMATASITEVDNQGRPFDSSASIMIQNVIPRDNGVINIRYIINWNSNQN